MPNSQKENVSLLCWASTNSAHVMGALGNNEIEDPAFDVDHLTDGLVF